MYPPIYRPFSALRRPAPAAVKNASVAVDLAVIPVAVAAAAGWGGGVPGEGEEHMRGRSCGLGARTI